MGGIGLCGLLLTGVSWIIVIVTLPFSLCVCFKVTQAKAFDSLLNYLLPLYSSPLQVVQEYERAVIFRLGRLLSGGSRGPGESMASRVKSSKVWSIALSIVFFSCRHLLRPALHRSRAATLEPLEPLEPDGVMLMASPAPGHC